MKTTRIGIVGDFDAGYEPHVATDAAIQHASAALELDVETVWLQTADIPSQPSSLLRTFDGLWIAPGSPYRNLAGALAAIRYARCDDRPLLGTCGGFQHVVLEYARNVLGLHDAQHAEYDPHASVLFIVPLSCSLVGKRMQVHLQAGSRAASAYGRLIAAEQYYCNFGLNPSMEQALDSGGLSIVGRDDSGEARVVEITRQRFFCATLFVPQLSSSQESPHPLICGFLLAANSVDPMNGFAGAGG